MRSLKIFLVVQPGEPAGQAVDGGLEARVEVGEVAQSPGHPGERDLLLTPPVDQLLDAAVGEVHQGMAFSSSAVCDAACRAAEPSAGAELGGSDTTSTSRPRCSGSLSARVGQAPMLAGSSWTQVTDSAAG